MDRIKQVSYEAAAEEVEFVEEAAVYFATHEQCRTFTHGDIKPGCLFAVRWGMMEDGILVFRLEYEFEPRNYIEAVRKIGGQDGR